MFIDLFVGEIHLWTVRDDQRELHPFRARSLALQQNTSDSRKNQFTYGAPACSSLFFQLPVQWRWDVDRGANRVLLHEGYYLTCAINMEDWELYVVNKTT